MSKKSKMGRPPLPKGEAKKVFPLRLSDFERANYERAAALRKMTLPDWMRSVLTDAAK